MYIVDTNILIAAAINNHPHHQTAKAWLLKALQSDRQLGLPVNVALGFIRIVTQARIVQTPLTITQAQLWLNVCLRAPNCVQPQPAADHMSKVFDLLNQVGSAGNLVSDAHIAVLAIEQGAHVVSFDRDFERFPGLQMLLLR